MMKQISTIAVCIAVIMGVLSGCTPKVVINPPPQTTVEVVTAGEAAIPTETLKPKRADATPEEVAEAIDWGGDNLLPIIALGKVDREIKVAALIAHLVAMAQSSVQITMGAQHDGPGLAWACWSKELQKPRIYLSVPDLRQYQADLTKVQFRDMLLAILCHETIHLELRMPAPYDPTGFSEEGKAIALDAEAKAWRRTVLEVIRPFRKAERYVTPMAQEADEALKACGDRDNREWREWVSSNLVLKM